MTFPAHIGRRERMSAPSPGWRAPRSPPPRRGRSPRGGGRPSRKRSRPRRSRSRRRPRRRCDDGRVRLRERVRQRGRVRHADRDAVRGELLRGSAGAAAEDERAHVAAGAARDLPGCGEGREGGLPGELRDCSATTRTFDMARSKDLEDLRLRVKLRPQLRDVHDLTPAWRLGGSSSRRTTTPARGPRRARRRGPRGSPSSSPS